MKRTCFFSKHKLVYMNLHHVLTSTRRFRADETFYVSQRLFQPIEFSLFRSLIGWIQAIKLRKSENSIGWKRFGSFISLHLAYRRKSVCFISFYEAKHFFFVFVFFQKKEKRSKSTRQTHFFKMSQTSFI